MSRYEQAEHEIKVAKRARVLYERAFKHVHGAIAWERLDPYFERDKERIRRAYVAARKSLRDPSWAKVKKKVKK